MRGNARLPASVSDVRANRASLLVYAAERLGKSELKVSVFEAIYYHKQQVKSVDEIVASTGLTRMRVLQTGNALVKDVLVGQSVKDGQVAYVQDPVYQGLKREILRLVRNPTKRDQIPTKERPKVNVAVMIPRIRAHAAPAPRFITIDSIDSFTRVRGLGPVAGRGASGMTEKQFKEGIQRIIGETSLFKDWPGELNDVYTINLIVEGKRRRAAFALKGPGKKGVLRPKHMGVNGDQIQRLFRSPADVFLIQHHDSIHESVVEQMEAHARLLAADRNAPVWYGIIGGTDSNRLIAAYPKAFATE
jgi:hypothetical protein